MHGVLCTGLMRSGSTWSYNVVRDIYGIQVQDLDQMYHIGYLEYRELDDALKVLYQLDEAVCFKTHHPERVALEMIGCGVLKGVYTHRDPRDCVCSYMQFKNCYFDEAFKWISCGISYWPLIRMAGGREYSFKQIVNEPRETALDICEYMGYPIMDDELDGILKLYSKKNVLKNIEGLKDDQQVSIAAFHKNHINDAKTDKWRTMLNKEQQHRCNVEFTEFINYYGYERE